MTAAIDAVTLRNLLTTGHGCAMGMLLAKLPYNRASAGCDLGTIIGRLR